MNAAFPCARAEELFSDYREGLLPQAERRDLDGHLGSCAACTDLLAALDEVVLLLRRSDAGPELEPARDLAARVADAALRAPAAAPTYRLLFRLPARVQALAAGLAVAVTAGFLLVRQAAGPSGRPSPGRLFERTVNAGVYLVERKDRLVDELRVLRVVVGTAFESRVDGVNDRVDDYRRLLEQQRRGAPEKESRPGSGATRSEPSGPNDVYFRTASVTGS